MPLNQITPLVGIPLSQIWGPLVLRDNPVSRLTDRMLRPSRKIKRRIFAALSINITCPFSAPKYADVNKTGGSILNANYPPKWVNFACLFTRQDGDSEIAVGRHHPPSSARVAAFMDHFGKRYQIAARSASGRIIAIASAHHRLSYIHPFPDGNGRVSRLMSHAMALNAGIGGQGLWSISRGLARGQRDRGEYKQMMDHADSPRRGDRDGRGNLSEAALKTFCAWFLNVALDQVTFSAKLFDLGGLDKRYQHLVADTIDDKRAPDLISAVLRHGALDRGDAQVVLKTSERTARNTLKQLTNAGFLTSASPKTPVRLAFPLDYRERLFPNLFSDADLPT